MSTFVLIPGAGSGPDHWHLVVPLLRAAGHETVTPELPCESDSAGLPEYTAAAIEAIGDRGELIIVAQSLGAFTGAAVAAARRTRLLVYVNAMIPTRGETPGSWWDAVGHQEAAAQTLARHGPMHSWSAADIDEVFLHDVPAAALALVTQRSQGAGIFTTPLTTWPDGVPLRVISGRDDRLFPLPFQQRVARRRLGVEPDVLPAGHVIALARPDALADQLLRYTSHGHGTDHRSPNPAAGARAQYPLDRLVVIGSRADPPGSRRGGRAQDQLSVRRDSLNLPIHPADSTGGESLWP